MRELTEGSTSAWGRQTSLACGELRLGRPASRSCEVCPAIARRREGGHSHAQFLQSLFAAPIQFFQALFWATGKTGLFDDGRRGDGFAVAPSVSPEARFVYVMVSTTDPERHFEPLRTKGICSRLPLSSMPLHGIAVEYEARAIAFGFSEVSDRTAGDVVRATDPTMLVDTSYSPAILANVELRQRQRALIELEVYPAIDIRTGSLFQSQDREKVQTILG
jgi:hypothetical protein